MKNVQSTSDLPSFRFNLGVALVILINLVAYSLIGAPSQKRVCLSTKPKSSIQKNFASGAKSVVKITLRHGKVHYQLFNRKGEKSYQVEEITSSYRVRNDFKYRKDGSVKSIVQHINPGGSRYMYTYHIKFDNDNNPQWMTSKRNPADLTNEVFPMNFYWDKNKKKWVKQESSLECAPVPFH